MATGRESEVLPGPQAHPSITVERGEIVSDLNDEELDPRTAIGINRNGRYLYVVVVDGRQPFYSSGATFQELAEIFKAQGAYFAMAMDGGGSSTLVVEGEDVRHGSPAPPSPPCVRVRR